MHRLDHGLRQRLGDIADTTADDACGLVRVGLGVGFHAAGDLGKQVSGFEFQEIGVDGCHGGAGFRRARPVVQGRMSRVQLGTPPEAGIAP